ncbi:DNA-binding FrmR family transcriptional regulator [Natranaerovirga hydrolytica]|uniref:DNA-binding FrmR family transcriptional regulator n=1 Tax=Natranaerovirga hydrolytica TaxID=680378 RepID=A0A4R1MKN8_9FIRM|nr:metal-sensing transcriptional repressor [Natranaerovirga hydrolytica]TCK92610.1 DNA-binding FrmR family transcriptional regulator [Natranaerovirga hydrolytica]
MRQCMEIEKVQARLKRIEGQVRGLSAMIEKDVPCEDILIQISAAKTALHKTGQIILEGHLHHCIADSIKNGEEYVAIEKLSKALEQFARLG